MADVYTDAGSAWSNAVATGYDKFLEYQLRSQPVFRQLVDKHPVNLTNIGPTITLSIASEFAALATTPLSETTDVAAVAPPNLSRVTVTLNEYGNADITTLRLKQLAFIAPDPAVAHLLGLNMVDSIDQLVRSVVDGATHVIGVNGGTVKTESTSFATASVTATDYMNYAVIRDAVALLRRRNSPSWDVRGSYLAFIHPDVSVDIKSDTGWLSPHQYVDTMNIYNAEVGAYLGARFVESPRCTIGTDGATGGKVYRSYFVGRQGVVEAVVSEPHVVVGPQTDKLRRFFPIGWLAHMGWSIFRQESLEIGKTSSSIAAL